MNDGEEDIVRKLVRGLLTLALTTAATWLAARLTDMILGPEKQEEDAEES